MNLKKLNLKAVLILCLFLVGSYSGGKVLADGTSASAKTRASVTFYYDKPLPKEPSELPQTPKPIKKPKKLPQTGEKKEILMSLLGIAIIIILFTKTKKVMDINRKI